MVLSSRRNIYALIAFFLSLLVVVSSFTPSHQLQPSHCTRNIQFRFAPSPTPPVFSKDPPPTVLFANENNEPSDEELSTSDATALATVGLITSTVMLYSESILFRTGCGLPAGPYGLTGAIEGISYLGTISLVAYSLYTKIRTGRGLPAGPGGVLGAAEGLAYIAIIAGFWVLLSQVANYGYIPNAVPMEGGMCQ